MAPSAGDRSARRERVGRARMARMVTPTVGIKVAASWDLRGEGSPSDGRRARLARRPRDVAAGQPGSRNDLRRLPGPPARRALAAARRVGPADPFRGGHVDQLRRQRRHAQPACAPRGTGRGASASSDDPAVALATGRDAGCSRLRPAPSGTGNQLRLRAAGESTPGARTDEGHGRHVPPAPHSGSASTRTVTAASAAAPAATEPHPAAAAAASASGPSDPSDSDPCGALRATSPGRSLA
jgi:hypothetical protein